MDIFKYIFIIKLVLFYPQIGAIAILGIGIWTHEVEYGSKQTATLVGRNLYQVDSQMMIACGTATILLMCVGLLGLLLPQKCLLGLVCLLSVYYWGCVYIRGHITFCGLNVLFGVYLLDCHFKL